MSSISLEDRIQVVIPGVFSRYVTDHTNVRSTFVSGVKKSGPDLPMTDAVAAIFKLSISTVKTSKHLQRHIENTMGKNVHLELNWKLFDLEDTVTSPEMIKGDGIVVFDFTNKYSLSITADFLESIKRNPIVFELYGVKGDETVLFGYGHQLIGNILKGNNLKKEAKVHFRNTEISRKYPIATLFIKYKFTCQQRSLSGLYSMKHSSPATFDSAVTKKFFEHAVKAEGFGAITKAEIKHFQDGLILVLNRNKALKTTQSEISLELKDRVNWLQYEANWRQTLTETAILSGKEPNSVGWRQWREADTASIKLREYSKKPPNYDPILTIKIKTLQFFQGSPFLSNDKIQQLYIAYSLLGLEGPEMETRLSLPKPAKYTQILTYDFHKSFPFDKDGNLENCKILAGMIKTNENIRFLVLNEPLEDPMVPIQISKEVGYADASLFKLVHHDCNADQFTYPVKDIKSNFEVGTMVVKFTGLLSLRRMALEMLAPKDFKFYQH